MARPLHEIALEIKEDWGSKVSPHAQPYLTAMFELTDITASYHADSADGIVRRFLVNSAGWHGPVAKRVKAELRAMTP